MVRAERLVVTVDEPRQAPHTRLVTGKDERLGRRVRLRLVDASPGADSTHAASMKRQLAAWEQTRVDERPIWLDEIGLEAHEVDQLRVEGAQLAVLRALGRRLRQEGRERTIASYRSLLEGDDPSE